MTSFPGLINCHHVICHVTANKDGGRCFRLRSPHRATASNLLDSLESLEVGKSAHNHQITSLNRIKSGIICNVMCLTNA